MKKKHPISVALFTQEEVISFLAAEEARELVEEGALARMILR